MACRIPAQPHLELHAMSDPLIEFLSGGMLGLGWLGLLAVLLVLTQLTILAVTLYLHRSQAHRGVDFHPVVSHFFRAWTWLTTSMITREWVAIHRKHHAKVETGEDPHSPRFKGIGNVFWRGVAWSCIGRHAHSAGRSSSTARARPTTGWSATCTRRIRWRARRCCCSCISACSA
jgi:fatty-acid desaturase